MEGQALISQILEQNLLLMEMVRKNNEEIATLRSELTAVIKFFATPPAVTAPAKRLSKRQKEDLEFEAHQKMLELKYLQEIEKGNKTLPSNN